MNLGTIEKNQSVSKVVYIQVKDIQNVRIDSLVSSSPYINAKLIDNPQKRDEGKIGVKVTALSELPIGRLNETITAFCNLENNSKAVLRVRANKIGDIEIKPESMNFIINNKNMKNLPKRILVINHNDNLPMILQNIYDPEDRFLIETKVIQEGYNVEILVKPKDEFTVQKKKLGGNLIIETNNPEQKTLTVRYGIRVY